MDERDKVLRETLSSLNLKPKIIKTDAKSSYKNVTKEVFPRATHEIYNRAQAQRLRDRLHENKNKKKFDPMFSLNHMCARLRADIRRLTRRSWCTTKKPERLQRHLDIFLGQFALESARL